MKIKNSRNLDENLTNILDDENNEQGEHIWENWWKDRENTTTSERSEEKKRRNEYVNFEKIMRKYINKRISKKTGGNINIIIPKTIGQIKDNCMQE